MEVKVISMDATNGVFEIKGADPSFLNAIRRMMLSHVPKLAIEDVTIYDNTSALFDEMVSHRLGLLPVPTDLNAFNRRWKDNNASPREPVCTCAGEGCPNCTVLYTLSKEGPCTVYSGDLVPAADAKFRIVDPKIPIVKLLEGQRVMLEVGAILGTGIEHAKWQVVTAVGYREYPTLKVPTSIPAATLEKISKTAPPNSVTVEGSALKVLDVPRAADYLLSVKELYQLEGLEVGREDDRWIYTVETDGSLSPAVAMRRAAGMLMEKLKIVENDVPKLKPIESAA